MTRKPNHRNPKLLLTRPAIPGECRFCKKPILHPVTNAVLTRLTWHRDCVREYEIHQNPRRACFLRDQGKCAQCEVVVQGLYGNWQADHIRPLALGGSFDLQNIQTLCNPCHFEKSRQDMKQIREQRKSQSGKAEAHP